MRGSETHKTKSLLACLGKLKHTKSALLVAHGENANGTREPNVKALRLRRQNVLQPYDVRSMTCCAVEGCGVRLSHSLDPEGSRWWRRRENDCSAAKPVKKEARKVGNKETGGSEESREAGKEKGKG